jgi:hypothetical protein
MQDYTLELNLISKMTDSDGIIHLHYEMQETTLERIIDSTAWALPLSEEAYQVAIRNSEE